MVCVNCFEVQKYTFSSVWQNFFFDVIIFFYLCDIKND